MSAPTTGPSGGSAAGSGAPGTIRVSVQAEPRDGPSWTALARRLEAGGFTALLMGDHPGDGASPWTALGAAAAVTDTLGVGTYVLNAGVRDPLRTAAEAATLNRLAPGRVHLGLGAGHTPAEWNQSGLERPDPAARVARLAECVQAITALLDGEVVDLDGAHVHLNRAQLVDLPTTATGAPPVRLALGGGDRALLALAARSADTVALSGLGRTLPDGHRHQVRWSPAELTAQLDLIAQHARAAGRTRMPVLEALVQAVEVTPDRHGAAEAWASRLTGTSVQEVLDTPFMLLGTHEQMAAQLRAQARRWGITRYVVRGPAVDDAEVVLSHLRSAA